MEKDRWVYRSPPGPQRAPACRCGDAGRPSALFCTPGAPSCSSRRSWPKGPREKNFTPSGFIDFPTDEASLETHTEEYNEIAKASGRLCGGGKGLDLLCPLEPVPQHLRASFSGGQQCPPRVVDEDGTGRGRHGAWYRGGAPCGLVPGKHTLRWGVSCLQDICWGAWVREGSWAGGGDATKTLASGMDKLTQFAWHLEGSWDAGF